MDKAEVKYLAAKFLEGTATAEEKTKLHNWYTSNLTEGDEIVITAGAESSKEVKNRLFQNIQESIGAVKRIGGKQLKLWPGVAAAAAILLVAGLGVLFYTSRHLGLSRHLDARRELLNYANDIAPGKNTATITLANGSTIVLSDAKTGVVVGTESLTYNDGGPVSAPSPGVKEMLTATTPRGGTYQITLPDGTKVWLNAASSLKFPASFSKLKDRRVELVGEGYFEVAKDKAHPFIVKTDKQEVEVLGTHFNINSYADEVSTKTTLLEGSVAVRHLEGSAATRTGPFASSAQLNSLNSTGKGLNSTDKRSLPAVRDDVVLKPGQQSVITGYNRINVKQVNISEAVAWKIGYFRFNDETLESIMRKVARWYDVDVIYEDELLRKVTFGGTVSRFANISSVLRKLELTGEVKFKMEGKKITVMK
jgi:ferric-dicitrate binding protein FerR (iron transport regulator)